MTAEQPAAARILETVRAEVDHVREWHVAAPDTPGKRVAFDFRPVTVRAVYEDQGGHVEPRTAWAIGPRVRADGSAGNAEHTAQYVRPLAQQSDAPAWLKTLLRERTPDSATRPLCVDCGHPAEAHAADGSRPCDASGARVRGCTCAYHIPFPTAD